MSYTVHDLSQVHHLLWQDTVDLKATVSVEIGIICHYTETAVKAIKSKG